MVERIRILTPEDARTTYGRSGSLFMPSDSALLKWRTKANEVISGVGQGHIAVLGDSIAYGAGVTGNSLPKWRWSWPGQLRELLDARFGKGGTGIVPTAKASYDNPTWDPRWRVGSAVSSYTFGWHRETSYRMVSGSANSWIEFDAYCDEFIVYSLSASAGVNTAYIDGAQVGTFRNITNAPTVTFPPQPGYSSKQIVSRIAVPTGLGQHTLRIETDNAATGRDAFIIAIEGRVNTPGSFRVSNHGFNGRSLASFGAKGTNNDETNTLHGLPMLDLTQADLLVMALGINDWQGNADVAGQKDALRTIIDRQRSNGTNSQGGAHPNGDVLLVWNAHPNVVQLGKDQALWEAYRDAYYEVAEEKNVPLLDVSKTWPQFTEAEALGLFGDTIHPSDKGSADIARSASIAIVGDAAAIPKVMTRAEAQEIYAPEPGYDIIPVLGQSNALGRGTGIDLTYLDGPDPRVQQFANLASTYADRVITAIEPLHHQELPGNTVGFALTFAKRYAQTRPITRKVLLVPCARGNTGFGSTGEYTWRVGQTGPVNLHSLAVAQINKALALPGKNRVAAILWHQGEANNATAAATYRTDLDNLIKDLRSRYGAKVPFILGQMSPVKIAGDAGYAAIDGVHRDTPNRHAHIGVWGSVPLLEADGLHFSAAGQRINGETAFDAYKLAQTAAGGFVTAPVVTAPGFISEFNTADSSTLPRTDDGKTARIVGTGATNNWGVSGNAAKYNGTSARSLWLVDGLSANGTVSMTVKTISQAVGGLAARATDANNYIAVLLRQSAGVNRLQLVKRIDGTQSQIGISAADKLAASGSVIGLVMNGTNLSVTLNGETVITGTAPEFASVTSHGFVGDSSDLAVTFDRIEFVPA